MMRQGQIKQVFIYIMALLVIAFMVLIALKLGGALFPQACAVENTQFLTSFQKGMDRATRFGTVANPSVLAPCDYNIICMVNASRLGDFSFVTTGVPENMVNQASVIQNSVRENVPFNVYLVEQGVKGTQTPVLLDERINTGDQNIVCVKATSGDFNFWIKGLGRDGILVYTQ